MKKILIISYFFPPRPGVGSNRIGGFAKQLIQTNWMPIILTPYLPDKPEVEIKIYQTPIFDLKKIFKVDHGISSLIEENTNNNKINVLHTYIRLLKRLIKEILFFPDQYIIWANQAYKTGLQIINDEKIDILFSSHSPATCHILASKLQKKTRLPWIADFRDLWTQNHYYEYSNLRKYFENRLEKKILRNASCIITVSKPLAEELIKKHKKNVMVITNGFSMDSNIDVEITSEFSITYTGQLYSQKRDPSKLFLAISELISTNILSSNDIIIRFYGTNSNFILELSEKYSIRSIVKYYGNIGHDESLIRQKESQLLLLLNWDDEREKGVYTGKLFEYLAAKRPIISIGGVHNKVVSNLLKSTGTGINLNDVVSIKKCITDYYNEYKKSGFVKYRGIEHRLQEYSIQSTTHKLTKLLDDYYIA